MAIKLEKETKKYLVGSIKRFFAEDMHLQSGDRRCPVLQPGRSSAALLRPLGAE
jgi:hypothetical protein